MPKDGTYIASSYVKFIESGGARVVPILADTPKDVVSLVTPEGSDSAVCVNMHGVAVDLVLACFSCIQQSNRYGR